MVLLKKRFVGFVWWEGDADQIEEECGNPVPSEGDADQMGCVRPSRDAYLGRPYSVINGTNLLGSKLIYTAHYRIDLHR